MKNYRIEEATFDEVFPIWRDYLWFGRKTPIEPTNPIRMEFLYPGKTWFFVAKDNNNKIIGVNSGFRTSRTHFRSRGIYVFPEWRRSKVATDLMNAVEEVAIKTDCRILWSMPRKSAFEFYSSCGFSQITEWDSESYEFGPNCFVEKKLLARSAITFDHKNIFLTHQNHFKFGYNGEWFNLRPNAMAEWFVTYGKCQRPVLDFGSECIETAKLIRDSTNLPIYVLFSGGIDSETVVRSFHKAGIPITAAICRFKDGLNEHDISYATAACNSLGIPYKTYDLDLLKFWESEMYGYCEQSRCTSPQLPIPMWLSNQVDGYVVVGSGECHLVKRVPDSYVPGKSEYIRSEWDLSEKEKIASWYRHFMVLNIPSCPAFFQYTPEIMYSFLMEPRVRELVADEHVGKLSTVSSKYVIYQKYFPELRERPKYTGFEKVVDIEDVHRRRLRLLFPNSEAVVKTPYDMLCSRLQYEVGLI